jgi:hypothetical protein
MQQSTDGLESLLVKLLECQDVAHHEPNCGATVGGFTPPATLRTRNPPRMRRGFHSLWLRGPETTECASSLCFQDEHPLLISANCRHLVVARDRTFNSTKVEVRWRGIKTAIRQRNSLETAIKLKFIFREICFYRQSLTEQKIKIGTFYVIHRF